MAFELEPSFASVGATPGRLTERRTAPLRPAGRADRILHYLLLSLLLHAVVLPFLKHDRADPALRSAPPLSVVLSPGAPTAPPGPAVRRPATRQSAPAVRRTGRPGTHSAAPARAASEAVAIPQPAPTRPSIDLDAAFAAARAMARGSEPGPMPHGPKRLPTVESVIARAVAPDTVVESRGSNGEHVLRVGNRRCVTPVLAPHFMEGVAMPTQCEIRKG